MTYTFGFLVGGWGRARSWGKRGHWAKSLALGSGRADWNCPLFGLLLELLEAFGVHAYPGLKKTETREEKKPVDSRHIRPKNG